MCHRPAGPGTGVGDRARARRVSAPTQIMLKYGPGMGLLRTKNGRASVWVSALGRLFCPRRPKQTAADEMGRPIEVALISFLKDHIYIYYIIKIHQKCKAP